MLFGCSRRRGVARRYTVVAACSRLIQARPVRANGNLVKHMENNEMAGHRESREIQDMVLLVRLQSIA